MILAKETNNSNEIHAELTEFLLHILKEEKPFLNDLNDYYVIEEMFTKIHAHLIERQENSSRLLARFQARNNSVRGKLHILNVVYMALVIFFFFRFRFSMTLPSNP